MTRLKGMGTEYAAIGSEVIEALDRYRERVETGGFLRAVLENDLQEACARADGNNQRILCDIVKYIYNEMPSACWGSPKKVATWLGEDRCQSG